MYTAVTLFRGSKTDLFQSRQALTIQPAEDDAAESGARGEEGDDDRAASDDAGAEGDRGFIDNPPEFSGRPLGYLYRHPREGGRRPRQVLHVPPRALS